MPQASSGTLHIEADIAGLRERGLHVAAEADERVADALDGGQQAEDLFGLAAGGERDDDVAAGEHAEIAVNGFGGMQEQRGAARGAERGGDLLRDDAALAHPGDDDAAASLAALEDAIDGAVEVRGHRAFEAVGKGQQGASLDANQLRWRVFRQTIDAIRTNSGSVFGGSHSRNLSRIEWRKRKAGVE